MTQIMSHDASDAQPLIEAITRAEKGSYRAERHLRHVRHVRSRREKHPVGESRACRRSRQHAKWRP